VSIKVIGAGFGRTGTLSLKMALEELGIGKCYHMVELFKNCDQVIEWEKALRGGKPNWDTIFSGCQSTVDFPACLYYKDLLVKYPDAKVILTYRDPESWYRSAYETILTMRPTAWQLFKIYLYYPFSDRARNVLKTGLHNKALIENKLFGGDIDDKQHVIDVFVNHLEQVRNTVPADRLLVYQVSEGWEPLCRFLGVPLPDIDFPRTNPREKFNSEIRDRYFSI
jgi:hypothetical protein